MTPTREQIEAAAKAMYEQDFPGHFFDKASVEDKSFYTRQATAALTAAAQVEEKPASRKLLNITEAMWQSAEKECKEIEAATIERCAQVVPTNWCDELLTGKNAPKLPLNSRDVEALLRGIQDRIRALRD